MPLKSVQVGQLIDSLYDFTKIDDVTILNETFENITISIIGSNQVLEDLKRLYSIFLAVNDQNFLSDLNGNTIELSDIEENIETSYIDFSWQISINKINWFKLEDQIVTAFFNLDYFYQYIKQINIFDGKEDFIKYEKLQIILPMMDTLNIIGENFTIANSLKDSWNCTTSITLPSDQQIKECVHIISNASIIFELKKFKFKFENKNVEIENILLTKYSELLLASLVQVFHSIDTVELKGLKHLKIKINNQIIPDIKIVQTLEESVIWAYEENTETRLKLLADRLSLHENNGSSLLEIVINHIQDAFTEAKDRYKFVITNKSEEFTKDLKDLLKDTKEKTDKYSEKTRNIISSLLRDILGSIFFLGLTIYSRFSSNKDFILSEDAQIIFALLGIYFLLSMFTQAIFNFWDMWLSQIEAHTWSESSMDYMTKETYSKYVTSPLKTRTVQFYIVQSVVILIYLCLTYLSFNIQTITKKIFEDNQTDKISKIHQLDINISISKVGSVQDSVSALDNSPKIALYTEFVNKPSLKVES